jgi:hypothetical protein
MCVQRFDDSLNSAIHITYRISLRSSSMPEPRDPLLKVLSIFIIKLRRHKQHEFWLGLWRARSSRNRWAADACPCGQRRHGPARQSNKIQNRHGWEGRPSTQLMPRRSLALCNDPSAGSPTETLLRLLLPLNDQVWTTFRPWASVATLPRPVRKPHLAIQSVVATGGVYKGQGRNQRKLMTCAY